MRIEQLPGFTIRATVVFFCCAILVVSDERLAVNLQVYICDGNAVTDSLKARLQVNVFQVKRSLSVRCRFPDNHIQIGVLPAHALQIESPPSFLFRMLAVWSEPRTLESIVDLISSEFPLENSSLIRDVAEDLVASGIVASPWPAGRYDRHQLYFDLQNVDPTSYASVLGSKSIGIIGAGGIGSTAAVLLAAAGVGKMVVSDGDLVEESNLSRTILFDESVVGEPKVSVVKRRVKALNSSVQVKLVQESYRDSEFIDRHFADCDLWLLSADEPESLHSWTSAASNRLKIPYIVAGYVETSASIGPLFVPGETACFECENLRTKGGGYGPQLNGSLQAPSYGPLNALSTSVAVNEILRYFLNLDPITLGQRLLVDSSTYEVTGIEFKANEDCNCRAETDSESGSAKDLAEIYEKYRESTSLNRLLLDELITSEVSDEEGLSILDVGCGIGTLAIDFAKRGHKVVAVDSSEKMLEILRRNLPSAFQENISIIQGDACSVQWHGLFDRILINLMLDYLSDERASELLANCMLSMKKGGRLIAVVPHPFKDSGGWKKRNVLGRWKYEKFIADHYFDEGMMEKSREDSEGNEILSGVKSYRRTVSSYFKLLAGAGFLVEALQEPRPLSVGNSANHEKSSRIPYFMVFRCISRN